MAVKGEFAAEKRKMYILLQLLAIIAGHCATVAVAGRVFVLKVDCIKSSAVPVWDCLSNQPICLFALWLVDG